MKLSLFSLAVVLSAGLVAAAPSPEAKKSKYNEPPPPPPRSAQSVSQTCSASQSSVKCCNQASSVGSKGHKVYYGENTFDLQCSQIVSESKNVVQSICSSTVACCQGEGCIAIAV